MQEIAKNDYYSVGVDEKKNRVYLAVKGFWKDPQVAPNYIDDIKKAADSVKSGYTIVANLTDMKAPTPEVGAVHMAAQEMLVNAGLSKTAEIVSSKLLQLSVDRYAETSGMDKMVFDDQVKAEKWLDEN
ncbi:MAG: hypothetical protein GY854_07390 [Deltaproteobacteria bacterium]|nr:hypothetical protein [Deltaproteobacteria bacterium]